MVGRAGNEANCIWLVRLLDEKAIIIVSQATPFAERKGLVTLQLSNFHRGMQLSNTAVR